MREWLITVRTYAIGVMGWLILVPCVASADDHVDLRGTWATTVTTTQGDGHPTFVLDQNGAVVSGTYRGAFGQRAVQGIVRGDFVELQFVVTGRGEANGPVVYRGTITGDTIRGTLVIANAVQGAFTAQRLGATGN
jgi:hypothetical protein